MLFRETRASSKGRKCSLAFQKSAAMGVVRGRATWFGSWTGSEIKSLKLRAARGLWGSMDHKSLDGGRSVRLESAR